MKSEASKYLQMQSKLTCMKTVQAVRAGRIFPFAYYIFKLSGINL